MKIIRFVCGYICLFSLFSLICLFCLFCPDRAQAQPASHEQAQGQEQAQNAYRDQPASRVQAQGQAQEPVMRAYMGVSAGNLLFAGSFNGSDFFQTDEDIMLVPKIRPAFGVGGVLGIALGNGSGEFAYYYYRSEYTTMDPGYAGECSTHLFRVLGVTKYLNAWAERRISPFIDGEMSVSHSVFRKIGYPIGQPLEPGSGTYNALIFGFGGGTRIWFTEALAMELKLLPELYLGTDIRMKGRERYNIKKFNNLMLHSTLVIKYYFKPV